MGSDQWRIVSELTPDEAEQLVAKTYGDSFEETDLEAILSGLGVGRLIVAGAQTDACIRSTLHGAITRGYDAILVSDAHTTEDLSAWVRRRRNRSSRTRTCIGPGIRHRPDRRHGRNQGRRLRSVS